MKNKILLTLIISTGLLLPSTGESQTMRTGRSVALAGSGALAMYGCQAAGWNPANLGLNANPVFSLSFGSLGLSMGNNAFSPEYIGNTFVKGDTLSEEKKTEILGKMSADKLDIYTNVGVPIFGLSIANFALNVDAFALGNASIPADVFRLILTGPVKDKTYDLSTVEESGLGYVSASLSTAKAFDNIPFTREFAVGATFKYIVGAGYSELVHKEGYFQVNDSTIESEGSFKVLNSTQIGDGIGLDLGAAGRLDFMDLYVGMTLGNIIGDINWNEVEAKDNSFSHHGGADLERFDDEEYLNDFFLASDTTYKVDAVTTPLPRYLLLSADKAYLSGKGDLFFSYYQGLNETPGQNMTPRLSLGSEFRWIPVLPLRAGIAVGGVEGMELAGGFGLRLLGYQMNLGASWHRGVAAGAQGFSFALTNYFGPGFKRPKN